MRAVGSRSNIMHDLVFPLLLFGSIGGMTWAVRGSSGFGASAGCIFAGVTLGTAWWYIAREPGGRQTRRYSSGWIVLAMVVAFGIAGNRGWMQWPAFWDNRIYIDYSKDSYTYIDRSYGYIWLFIAGVPWAGLGACMMAWCAEGRRTPPWLWLVRLGFGLGMCYLLSVVLYGRYPNVFLPLYDTLREEYAASPRGASLWKMVRDNREAMQQLGLYLGFLLFELVRRDWKNVTLISTVGVVNGTGWALLQNWSWFKHLWPNTGFNFWRGWETSGGISIGIAFAVAYFLVNRRMTEKQLEDAHAIRVNAPKPDWTWLLAYIVYAAVLGWVASEVMPIWRGFAGLIGASVDRTPWIHHVFPTLCSAGLALIAIGFGVAYFIMANAKTQGDAFTWSIESPALERWGTSLGLILGMGISIERGFKGWANIYWGNEHYWDNVGWIFVGTLMVGFMLAAARRALSNSRAYDPQVEVSPRAYELLWFVILTQNVIAQLITGPLTNWNEVIFNIYYVLLFLITVPIVHHYRCVKRPSRSHSE